MSRRIPSLVFTLVAGVCAASGDITGVQVSGITSTQAVLNYTAPDTNPCTVEISPDPAFGTLVNDVNPLLFAGANLDNRSGAISAGGARTFVAGTRIAQVGADGRRYSRALQALTQHFYRITCGVDQATGNFTTSNIPLGAGYFDPLPTDPASPGTTAWPGFYGRSRSDSVIDPQTGLQILRGTMPGDFFNQFMAVPILEAQDLSGGAWSAQGCAAATACVAQGSGTLVNSSGSAGFVFLSNRDTNNIFQAKSYQQNLSFDWTQLHLTAWCSGASCATAADADRTITVCLTVNRVSCETPGIDQTLGASGATYTIGGTTPVLVDWTNAPAKLNMVEMRPFNGTVTVQQGSAQVTLASGDVFSIWWTAGSVININGANYTIASIVNDGSLLLASPWTGASGNATYTASNTGFLIRKKTASTDAISLGTASFDYGFSLTLQADSSGLQHLNWACSPVQQDLGGGVMGRLCNTSLGLYAVETATGVHRSLGSVGVYVAGQYSPPTACPGGLSSAVFDATDPNKFYCLAQDHIGRTSIFSLKYYGNFSDLGPLSYTSFTYQGQTCKADHSNTPCLDQVNLDPPPNNIEAQLSTDPDWSGAPTAFLAIGGRQGNKIGIWGHMGNQNSRGWFMVFDPATQKLTGAAPSFRYWPARWAGIHSWNDIQDPNYVRMPIGDLVTQSTALSGYDTPGMGPFGATYLGLPGSSGVNAAAMPSGGQACPAQPAGSPIAASDWPTGNRCVTIQVDGETCDPSPGAVTSGTVSTGSSLSTIVASGNVWSPSYDGLPMLIGGVQYTFNFVNPSSGTLTPPAAAAFSGQPYVLLIEGNINNPKCGNPSAFYLQDAQVRDVLMFTAGNPWTWVRQNTEFMRLLMKNGNTWTLERGYKGQAFQTAWPANTMLWQYQASCPFSGDVTQEACDVFWNFTQDAMGQNASGSTMVLDPTDVAGHTGSAFGANFGVDAKPYPSGASVCSAETDWTGTAQHPCYFVRQGPIPNYMTNGPSFVSSMPAFAGIAGIGFPNAVDTHPTFDQIAAPGQQNWFLDARPLNGGPLMVGTSASPGVNIGGSLWKFTYAQRGCASAAACSQERKLLPTLAAINRYPLLDISQPSTCAGNGRRSPNSACRDQIGTTSSDWFKYCVAERAGECRVDSSPGDLYVNGPISQPFCDYPGIAVTGGGTFDPCIGPAGPYTHSIVQIGFPAPNQNDWSGSLSRVLTHGLMRYRWFTPFWNVRTFEDASWLFWRADWLDGVRSEWMAARLPPYPAPDNVNRSDFIPVAVQAAPTDPAAASAQVEFGYAENGSPSGYFCTSRREACVRATQTGDGYAYAGDHTAPLPCVGGCSLTIPAISQRVLYYQVQFFDGNGNPLAPASPVAVAVP